MLIEDGGVRESLEYSFIVITITISCRAYCRSSSGIPTLVTPRSAGLELFAAQ